MVVFKSLQITCVLVYSMTEIAMERKEEEKTQNARAWKVGKIPTLVFLVSTKITFVIPWISSTRKRESTKLSAIEAPGQEPCLAKIPSARKIFLSAVLVSHLSNLQ